MVVDTTTPTSPRLRLDQDEYQRRCGELAAIAREEGVELQMWLTPGESSQILHATRDVSQTVDVTALVESSAALAKKHGWSGINFDDEAQDCPRVGMQDLEHWLTAVDAWAVGMHSHGLKLTVDIQFLTCSVFHEPNKLELYPQLAAMYSNTSVDEWLEMDTYYGDLGFFYDNLDFYVKYMPRSVLGIGQLPNAHPQPLELDMARFYAIDKADVPLLGIFRLPVQDVDFLRLVRKWRTRCQGCQDQGVLTCWESGHRLPGNPPDCM